MNAYLEDLDVEVREKLARDPNDEFLNELRGHVAAELEARPPSSNA